MRKTMVLALFMFSMMMAAGLVQAEPPIDMETDKETYSVGETVYIYKVNNWKDYIVTRFGVYVTTCQNQIVWDPFWVIQWIAVPPGGSLEYTWDQTYYWSPLGDDGEQVATGCYRAHDLGGSGFAEFWIE